ncbi:MAG: tetratricopeptide repeat protein, partial [Chloroflexota bacterium]
GQAIGSDHLFGQAEERRGTALSFLGHAEESRRALETSIPLLEAVGDLSTLFRAVGNLGESFRLLGDLASARIYQERCLEVCERAGDPSQVAFTLTNVAEILTTMGDWQEAETYVDRAQDILSTLESATYMRGYPPMMRAELFRLRGEWDSATDCLRETQEIGKRTNDRQSLDISNTIWASVDLARGDPQSALDRLAPLAEEPDAPLAKMLPILSRAHLGLGDRERALGTADEAVKCARAQEEGLCLVDALQSRAMVMTAFERFDEARADLDEALKLATAMPFPYGEAGILCDLATVDAAQGETGRARERREQALATFQKLGARREVERVEGLLEVSAG